MCAVQHCREKEWSGVLIESSTIGLLRLCFRTVQVCHVMMKVREEDELVRIPLRNVVPAIPKWESEMRELVEDLTQMGCEGLLAKP